jgi:hypothetical protein
MDKLQPLIKHRYWICFGLATIFVLTAWFLASGKLAAEIDARTASVKSSFDKSGQGKDQPNQKWVEAAKKKNEGDALAYKNAAKSLRERQISARQWPELIREEMKGIAYQEQIQNQLTREKWAANYKDEVESLLEIVKPWKEGKGLVVVDSNRITHRPYNTWRTKNPQSREIWDAQEDIWLLRALLTSISTANGTAERITESAVREIYRLHLRGGDRNAAGASSSGAGGMGGGMGGMGGGSGEMSTMGGAMGGPPGMGGMGLGGGGMGGAGVSTAHPGSSFEGSAGSDILTEEFGAVAGSGGGMGGMGGEGGKSGSAGMMSMGSIDGGMGSGGMAGAGGAAAPAEEDRYIDEVPESYKTRGFLLDVLVRDDRVPDLLAALTDSDFPVEIVRVEIEANSRGGGQAGGMSGLGGEGSGDLAGLSGAGGMGSMPNLGGYPDSSGGGGSGGSMGLSGPPSGGGIGPPGLPGMPGRGGMSGPPGGRLGEDDGSGADGGLSGGTAFGTQNQKDAETLRIAMSDESLVLLRIGGLMTLYQSAEEAKSAEATEAAAATETTNAAPPTDAPPADPNAPSSEGTAPATDPAAPPAPQPADPSATPPMPDPNAPAAPGSPAQPASGEPAPAQPGAPAPTDPATPAAPGNPATPPTSEPSGSPNTPPAGPVGDPPSPPAPNPPAGDGSPPAAPGQ